MQRKRSKDEVFQDETVGSGHSKGQIYCKHQNADDSVQLASMQEISRATAAVAGGIIDDDTEIEMSSIKTVPSTATTAVNYEQTNPPQQHPPADEHMKHYDQRTQSTILSRTKSMASTQKSPYHSQSSSLPSSMSMSAGTARPTSIPDSTMPVPAAKRSSSTCLTSSYVMTAHPDLPTTLSSPTPVRAKTNQSDLSKIKPMPWPTPPPDPQTVLRPIVINKHELSKQPRGISKPNVCVRMTTTKIPLKRAISPKPITTSSSVDTAVHSEYLRNRTLTRCAS